MTAEMLSIGALHVTHHLRASQARERDRLDRLIRDSAAEILWPSLLRVGFSLDEEICVRQMATLLRPRLSAADSAIALEWSLSAADELTRLVREHDPSVVRYASRRHALLDLVRSAARGDLTRAWAWRQLGLWTGSIGNRGDCVRAALGALAREGRHAPSILALIGDMQDGTLRSLVEHGRPGDWQRLIAAVVASYGAALPTESATTAPGNSSIERRAARVLRNSTIARGVARTWPATSSPEHIRALATLVVIETEPSALMDNARNSTALVSAVELQLQAHAAAARSRREHRQERRPEADRPEPEDGTIGNAVTDDLPARIAAKLDKTRDRPPAGSRARSADQHRRATDDSARASAQPFASADSPARDEGHFATDAGGLLYLLNIVSALELHQSLQKSGTSGDRSLRWAMHALARVLQPIEADDPAALAFAGVAPGHTSPLELLERPSNDEQLLLEAVRHRIVAELRARLPEPEASSPQLLDWVCQRRAVIVADPGWLEVRFSLDDVSVTIRRALLDVDPGWLPWLGVVVRFVYA